MWFVISTGHCSTIPSMFSSCPTFRDFPFFFVNSTMYYYCNILSTISIDRRLHVNSGYFAVGTYDVFLIMAVFL